MLNIRISVYIRPVCINALCLRESLSQLGLRNNALGLRESPCHDLVCITMPLDCVNLLVMTWLAYNALSLPVSSLLDLDPA